MSTIYMISYVYDIYDMIYNCPTDFLGDTETKFQTSHHNCNIIC